ncbi:MAG: glycosyltransferase family 2 protein [Prolixibacteraceae bacterium]|jgi:glycosyltransferase involved in cell wall biosynthesis|nr:glycosyltransferase family 2 protein [Prolixibacteraceae bacterium]MBT5527752.1 glycosyltransferase family 2 protein [Cytophagia bacterium]MBT6004356.1 glycosyltransferase family 2 protein [Prolixibacteraceae bacterium]MBT6764069.1 glycosyltransferase family 2 protein [Prolixibacteraceae bacterium]MBT6999323.1 glycosyltransferase family 2 protein [Prolixibacteraceae bacterium]
MNEKFELSIIIPSYNEEENLKIVLPPLIDYCGKKEWQIIVVNDGSSDNSKAVLQDLQGPEHFKIVQHKLNRGYGGAIKSGIMACGTEYCITVDADGQHQVEDVGKLFECMKANDADMVVGSRRGHKSTSVMRGIGKWIIRRLAKILMTVPIYDINSGMKIYRTKLAQKYIHLTPDTMAFSDTITLVFINNRHLVLEEPITVSDRLQGKSTIGMQTAFQTVMEIINIIILFNPLKIFLPISFTTLLITLGWGIPLLIQGRGISTGTLLGIIAALLFFFLGLIAEQLSLIRRNQVKNNNK